MHHLVGSFAEAVKWWIKTRMDMAPEELADAYLRLIGYDDGIRFTSAPL